MTDKPDQEKKIIVDEDWKTKVQAEKEALQQKEADADAKPAESGKTAEPEVSGGAGESASTEQSRQMPPASLTMLATTLATQAMVAMGLIPSPLKEKSECRLDEAKHFIDTLQILEEKTEGNRTAEESEVLEGMLHELRMGFVAVQGQQGQSSDTKS